MNGILTLGTTNHWWNRRSKLGKADTWSCTHHSLPLYPKKCLGITEKIVSPLYLGFHICAFSQLQTKSVRLTMVGSVLGMYRFFLFPKLQCNNYLHSTYSTRWRVIEMTTYTRWCPEIICKHSITLGIWASEGLRICKGGWNPERTPMDTKGQTTMCNTYMLKLQNKLTDLGKLRCHGSWTGRINLSFTSLV